MNNLRFKEWLVFVSILVALVFLLRLIDLADTSADSLAALKAEVSGLRQQVTALDARVEAAQQQHEAAPSAVALPPPQPEVAAPVPTKSALDTGALMDALLDESAHAGKGAAELSEGESNDFDFDSQRFDAVLNEQMVDVQYGELFVRLNLPPEREEALRKILIEANREIQSDERDLGLAESIGVARAAASGTLSPDELAVFDQFAEELPHHIIRQSHLIQLEMVAPGLDSETKSYVADVLAEESLAEHVDPWSEDALGMDLEQRRDAMERALARLEGDLSSRDLQRVQRYVQQEMEMFGAMDGSNTAPDSK